MIKVEHKTNEITKLEMFAFQGSGAEDFAVLDGLREMLENRPDIRVAFLDSKRLVVHFKPATMESTEISP